MSSEAPAQSRGGCERFDPARVHIAGKEKYTRNTRRIFRCQDQSSASAIAPTDQGGAFEMQRIHQRQNVRCHQLIAKRLLVACAPAVAAAVHYDRTTAVLDKSRDLISPIATVP